LTKTESQSGQFILTRLVKAEKRIGLISTHIKPEKMQSKAVNISLGKITIATTNEKRISNAGVW